MIATLFLALALASPADAPKRVETVGTATIRIERAEPVRAESFDPDDPRALVVEREENGQTLRLHLIEFE